MGEEGPPGAAARAQIGEEGHQGDSTALQPPRLPGPVVPTGKVYDHGYFIHGGLVKTPGHETD